MKSVEKHKKKLKRWNWLNKHLGTVVLAIYFPLLIANGILLPIVPAFAIGLLCTAFLAVIIGGGVKLWYADDENVKLTLEQEIKAMETASEDNLYVLDKTIEQYEQNSTMFKDEKATKQLVKELKSMRKSVKMALDEQKDDELEV